MPRPKGCLYRIDLRLRPEGNAGPLSRSIASYENYYAQWGQTWERMMLIKARGVSGDEAVAAEFLETINPFRYPRSVGGNVLHEIGLVKDRIENEVVKAGELERNVKLGWGGIREIEFIAQSLQLLHAGRQPFLQGAQTLPCLAKLVQYELLSRQDSRALSEAYVFLRDVEHRLQMENNLQTHTIPTSVEAQQRLAKLMGLPNAKEFWSVLKSHTKTVRSIFVALLKSEAPQSDRSDHFPPRVRRARGGLETIAHDARIQGSGKGVAGCCANSWKVRAMCMFHPARRSGLSDPAKVVRALSETAARCQILLGVDVIGEQQVAPPPALHRCPTPTVS